MANPSIQMRVFRCNCLVAAGAVLLLIGLLVFCYAALRTSSWMVDVQSKRSGGVADQNDEDVLRWFALTRSIEREAWIAVYVFVPVGLGVLSGGLVGLVMANRARYSVRAICIATLYFAITLGIPFGIVRPRLQNPRIWLQRDPPSLIFGQRKLWPQADSRDGANPWESAGPHSSSSRPFVDLYVVLVAIGAFVFAWVLVLMPLPAKKSGPLPAKG